MRNIDTRVQYTKARFQDAMLSLLEQKPIGAVTVKALCEEAGLNRGTFYLHYSEPIDVLREIEWALFDRISVYLRPMEGSHAEQSTQLLEALRKEQRLCAAVIGRHGDPRFLHELSDKVYAALREKLSESNPDRSEAEIRARFAYLFSGCTGMVSFWLEGNGLSNEETANLLLHLCDIVMQ